MYILPMTKNCFKKRILQNDWIQLKNLLIYGPLVPGLSIYGKMTIIKFFLIPKYIYICSILPTPKELLKELSKILSLFKFLWKGVEKVTRASVINEYEEGGQRMVDLECMVKSLRLAWLKRFFSGTNGTWKSYLQHILSSVGGLFFFNCNYNDNLRLHNYFSILSGTFVMVVAIL